MSKRLAWLFGVVVLISIGLLVACGSNYDPSSNGLLLVGSQGSGLIETFSFNLFNGHLSEISNTPVDTSNDVCVLNGIPSSIVVNPAGTFAYAVLNANNTLCQNGGTTGIQTFKINSDGNAPPMGSPMAFNQETVTILGTNGTVSAPVVPGPMVMDPSGKFLFVADRATTTANPNPTQSPGSPAPNPILYVPGAVSVFAIGSGGSITEVAGSPFFTTGTANPPTTVIQASFDIASVAPTPTVFPAIGVNGVQNSVCSTLTPPTTEYLYAVDGLGNQVFEFQVNTSSGVLTNPASTASVPSFATDQTPAGVAVDPCNRFVYVSDSLTNKVSAYSICNGYSTQSTNCLTSPLAPGALVPISGSPFGLTGSSNGPGQVLVDPYGNNVYVLGTLSNTISALKISPVSGALTALSPATVATGSGPASMAIRADDNWLFVANHGSPSLGGNSVSQFSITPATGALSAQPIVPTDNYPWGVAVK